jgi:uncharacterized protein (DUF3820 family)
MQKLTDESLMPFGKYKGTRMIDVPYFHLLWLFDNDKCDKEVKEYIEDNLDALHAEKKNAQANYKRENN